MINQLYPEIHQHQFYLMLHNPENHTVFNLCKYATYLLISAYKRRILQTTIDDVVFGFIEDNINDNDASLGIWNCFI